MVFQLTKVLISDEVDPKCVEILQRNGIDAVLNTKLSKEELVAEISKYDGLIVRSATKVTAEVIAAATKLKIIGRAGTGVDNIDCVAATKHGVIVMNTPGGNTLSAAELTCAMMLTMSRHIAQGTASLKAGRWDRKKYMGNEVYGKTLGIIGLGRIGQELAVRMQSFGVKTIGYDPIIPGDVSATFGVEWLPLEEIWPQADYLTVHTPLIPQTRNLINDEVFSKCKRGVRVINCARGGIIDEDALLRALESGQCAGAGLDVFLQEPPQNTALISHPAVTCTPHLGASTTEAQSRVAQEIAEQFVDLMQGKSLVGAINAHALCNALSDETRPWVSLGVALGTLGVALLGQVTSETQLSLTTQGSSLKSAGSYLSAAALVGLLRTPTESGLNLVSAPALGKNLGIKVTTEHKDSSPEGAGELFSLKVQQPGGATVCLSGLVGGGQPCLTQIDGLCLSQGAQLTGDLLVYKSAASPQTLPAIIGALSSANVQVKSFAVSAAGEDGAWGVMAVSAPMPSTSLLQPHVTTAHSISL